VVFCVRVRSAHATVIIELLRDGTFEDVDAELSNVRAGLCWAIAHEPARVDRAAVDAFIRYGTARSGYRELYRVLGALGEVAPDDVVRATALRGAGMGAIESGDHATADALAGRALELFEKLGDVPGRAAALNVAGTAAKAGSDFPAAESKYRVCLELAEAAGFARGITVALNNLGTLAHATAEY